MRVRNKFNIIFMVGFLGILLLPVTAALFKIDSYGHLNENRKLTPAPRLKLDLRALSEFPAAFQSYFNDHFGFRSTLVSINYLFKHKLLGVSPSSQVILGKEGWLYYTGDSSVEDYRGITQFDEDKLQRWLFAFELKRKWLELQGIKYLFVIAPNKESVYPEYLPNSLGTRVRNETALDDFLGYFKKYSKVGIIDLRPDLLAAKKDRILYFRTDTHWNNYGAFIGYRTIMQYVAGWFPRIRIFSRHDFAITPQNRRAGDLADLMGGAEFLKESEFYFKPLRPFSSYEDSCNGTDPLVNVMKKNDTSLPRALIFRNSFANALVPFLSENFQFIQFYWQLWGPDTPINEMISQTKPNVVIEETVERLLKLEPDFISSRQTGESMKFYKDLFEAAKKGFTVFVTKEEDDQPQNEQIEIVKILDGYSIRSSRKDPRFLTELKTESKGYPLVRLNIKSSAETEIRLLYSTKTSTEYKKNCSVSIPLKKGTNEIYIPFYRRDIDGTLKIAPADRVGGFLIKAMEVRFI